MDEFSGLWARKCALHGIFTGPHCVPCYAKDAEGRVSDEYSQAAEDDYNGEAHQGMMHSDESSGTD